VEQELKLKVAMLDDIDNEVEGDGMLLDDDPFD
jgi:serine/threonine protein kinase